MARSKVESCIVKVGQPDIVNGMETCGTPVFYAVAGEVVDGAPVKYSGWRHVYDGEYDHLGVPRSWV